jgi:hypothetical protein
LNENIGFFASEPPARAVDSCFVPAAAELDAPNPNPVGAAAPAVEPGKLNENAGVLPAFVGALLVPAVAAVENENVLAWPLPVALLVTLKPPGFCCCPCPPPNISTIFTKVKANPTKKMLQQAGRRHSSMLMRLPPTGNPLNLRLSSLTGQQQIRHLSIHEYLSMGILNKYGVNQPKGGVAKTAKEAFEVASKLGKFPQSLVYSI